MGPEESQAVVEPLQAAASVAASAAMEEMYLLVGSAALASGDGENLNVFGNVIATEVVVPVG